jgi:hypothetical protein
LWVEKTNNAGIFGWTKSCESHLKSCSLAVQVVHSITLPESVDATRAEGSTCGFSEFSFILHT